MALSLPDIDVKFKQLANSFITRSERGVAILIIRDNTTPSISHKEYEEIEDLKADSKLYSSENYQYIMDIMSFGVAKVGVVRINAEGDDPETTAQPVTDALKIISQKYRTGWIGMVGEESDYEEINSWVKAKAKEHFTFKTVCVGIDGSDHECIHELDGGNIKFADERGVTELKHYIPSIIGIASACNITRGITYYECKNLVEVEEVQNVNTSLNNGKLLLINDFGVVKIGLGINSLTTFDNEEKFEDMRYIDIVEAMHMIKDDIREVYKNDYVSKCKNKLDNQMIFISAVNTYFDTLEGDDVEVLDNSYDNVADVDVAEQRKAWIAIKPEAKNWDDAKVKNMAFKRTVFITGDVKILGAMENLKMNITTN